MLGMILLVVLAVLLLSAVPQWPHGGTWSYLPGGVLSSALSVILVMVIILLFLNRL
ncbi:MAG: DUF3309 family protein [Acidiferrobacterales bacterium]